MPSRINDNGLTKRLESAKVTLNRETGGRMANKVTQKVKDALVINNAGSGLFYVATSDYKNYLREDMSCREPAYVAEIKRIVRMVRKNLPHDKSQQITVKHRYNPRLLQDLADCILGYYMPPYISVSELPSLVKKATTPIRRKLGRHFSNLVAERVKHAVLTCRKLQAHADELQLNVIKIRRFLGHKKFMIEFLRVSLQFLSMLKARCAALAHSALTDATRDNSLNYIIDNKNYQASLQTVTRQNPTYKKKLRRLADLPKRTLELSDFKPRTTYDGWVPLWFIAGLMHTPKRAKYLRQHAEHLAALPVAKLVTHQIVYHFQYRRAA